MKTIVWGSLLLALALAPGCRHAPTTPERPVSAALQGVSGEEQAEERTPDVIYVPTPPERVQAMLELARPQQGQKLYDLGCGDGRIPIAAAKQFGVRAVCIDIDPERIEEARENVREAGVEDLVEVRQADLFETDLSDADIVTLYLLPSLNEKLKPKLLRELKPGARVVSHAFDMGTWQPDATQEVSGSPVYLWMIPER